MKAGIITHYNVHNHGAQLQLYALSQILKDFGYDARALQFNKSYDFMDLNSSEKYNISFKSIPIYVKYLFNNGLRRTLFNIKKRRILNRFRIDNQLTGEYYSKAKKLDLVVIGSDEIFSIESGLNPCFFGMGVPCNHIISYGASFGPTTIDLISKLNAMCFVKAGLEQIDEILVRDENSRRIVESLSIKKPKIVCDPVLLYDFRSNCSKDIDAFTKRMKKDYCIVYSYDYNMNDPETISSIRKYAFENNLQVVSIGYFHKWCDKNLQLKPLDVFKWFAGAKMVFTDTFHGTVISLATHTQFVVKITTNINKLGYLLEQYDVTNRKVNNFHELFVVTNDMIDYTKTGYRIEKIRTDSLFLLKNAIENRETKDIRK